MNLTADKKAYAKAYYAKHSERLRIYHRARYLLSHGPAISRDIDLMSPDQRRERLNEMTRERRVVRGEELKQKRRILQKAYRERHAERLRKECVAREMKRRATDPIHRLKKNLANRLYKMLRFEKSESQSNTLLMGCSRDQLRAHIEKLFTPGMSWENYGQWHVDHKRPCASFDFKDEAQVKACFHYTNLQPLWAKDNLHKRDKWESAT